MGTGVVPSPEINVTLSPSRSTHVKAGAVPDVGGLDELSRISEGAPSDAVSPHPAHLVGLLETTEPGLAAVRAHCSVLLTAAQRKRTAVSG